LPAVVVVRDGQPILVPPDLLKERLDEIAHSFKTDEKVARRAARHKQDRENLGRYFMGSRADGGRYVPIDQFRARDNSTGQEVLIKNIPQMGKPSKPKFGSDWK
jgi:hypothetical protein